MQRTISRRQMLGLAGIAAAFPSMLLTEQPAGAKDLKKAEESPKQVRFRETGRLFSTKPGTGIIVGSQMMTRAELPDGRVIETTIDFFKLTRDFLRPGARFFEMRMIGNGVVATIDEAEASVFSLNIENDGITPKQMGTYRHTTHASEYVEGKKEIIRVAIDNAGYSDWKDTVLATITRDGFFHVWNAGMGNGTYLDLEAMLKRRKWPGAERIADADIFLRGRDWFILPIGMPGANVNFGYSLIYKSRGIIAPGKGIGCVPTYYGDERGLRNFYRLAGRLKDAGSEGPPESVVATVDAEQNDGTIKPGFTPILEPIR